MRNLHRALLAGSLGITVSFVAACGGGAGLLSGDQAGALQSQLDRISAALDAGHCNTVRSATRSLVDEVASLPATVSNRLRQDLDQGASQVSTLAVQQCHTATTTTTPTTTTTTTTTTTPTTTTPTVTTTTPTTPNPPAPTTTTPATTPTTPGSSGGSSGGGGLSGGAGDGAGVGGGNGNGNG